MSQDECDESKAKIVSNSSIAEGKEATYICQFCSSQFSKKEEFLLHFTESACKIQSIGRIENRSSSQVEDGKELPSGSADPVPEGENQEQSQSTTTPQIICTVDMILCEQGNRIFIAPDTIRMGEQPDNVQRISFICQMSGNNQSGKSNLAQGIDNLPHTQQIVIAEGTEGNVLTTTGAIETVSGDAAQHVEVFETVDTNTISEEGVDVQLVVHDAKSDHEQLRQSGVGGAEESNASSVTDEQSAALGEHEYQFQCHLCEKRLKTKAGLERHKIFHAREKSKTFPCDTCGKNFTTQNRLLKHEEIHEKTREEEHRKKHEMEGIDENADGGNETFICESCQRTFSHSCCLLEHERSHFKENLKRGKDRFPCGLCDKSFHAASHLARHEKSHDKRNEFTCEECGESFARKNSLLKHRIVHSDVKPFVCHICSRGFMQSSNLTTHLRIHTKAKPYPCSTCGKTFSHSSSRVIHERTHTGEKPYVCETCGKRFRQSGDLAKHMRSHTGEKPYHCAVCAKTFSVQSNLLAHLRIHVKKNSQNAAALALVLSEGTTGTVLSEGTAGAVSVNETASDLCTENVNN